MLLCVLASDLMLCLVDRQWAGEDVAGMVGIHPTMRWIDPMVTAECIAAKSQYAGHLYLQFELEESWDRPGV
jgi:hypothetical protein